MFGRCGRGGLAFEVNVRSKNTKATSVLIRNDQSRDGRLRPRVVKTLRMVRDAG